MSQFNASHITPLSSKYNRNKLYSHKSLLLLFLLVNLCKAIIFITAWFASHCQTLSLYPCVCISLLYKPHSHGYCYVEAINLIWQENLRWNKASRYLKTLHRDTNVLLRDFAWDLGEMTIFQPSKSFKKRCMENV